MFLFCIIDVVVVVICSLHCSVVGQGDDGPPWIPLEVSKSYFDEDDDEFTFGESFTFVAAYWLWLLAAGDPV